MPDTLNLASVRAACDAMRAAYRPDCIPLRPDAMEAAIRAFLAAEAELGWEMRPRWATEEMLDGASRENSNEAVWTAMWDAAAIGAKP